MVSVSGYATLLSSIHGIAAMVAKTPEIALTDDEAQQFARALAEVEKHYPLPVLKPEYVALGALATTMFTIYRGKIIAVAARKAAEASTGARNEMPSAPMAGEMPAAAPWFNLTGAAPN